MLPLEPGGRLARGQQFEALACRHLEAHGLSLLARNFRARGGEVDLVMADRGTVVFVEVRSRAHARLVDPAATVTPMKQHRVIRAAHWFLARHSHLSGLPCRFDVVGITGSLEHNELTWLKAAFTA